MPGDFFVTLHDESVSPLPPAHWETQPAQHSARTPLATLTSPPTIRLDVLGHSPWAEESKKAFFPFRLWKHSHHGPIPN